MTIQEAVAIIDRSGSMRGKEADTVGGINTAINELKKGKGEADTILVSIKLFDNEQIMKLRSVDITEVEDFHLSEFIPRGQTALYDAIGDTLKFFMEKKLHEPTAYDSCVIYVASDGLENSSKKYTAQSLKEMIFTAETTYNISILYLGANQDAIMQAGNIGIRAEHAINYTENHEATEAVYRSAARVASDMRSHNVSVTGFTNMERQASLQQENSNHIPIITRQFNVLPSFVGQSN